MSPDYLHVRQEGGGIVGHDWHHCAIIARLVEYSLLKLYKYVRFFFVSGVKVPVTVLRLWSGAIDPRYNLPPFLLQMAGLLPLEHDSGRGVSRVMGLKLIQLGGMYRSASIATRAVRESGPFRPQREASSSPL